MAAGCGGIVKELFTQVSHVKKEENKCEKNVPGHSGQLRPKPMRVCQKERHTLFFVPRHKEMKVVLTLTSYNGNVF